MMADPVNVSLTFEWNVFKLDWVPPQCSGPTHQHKAFPSSKAATWHLRHCWYCIDDNQHPCILEGIKSEVFGAHLASIGPPFTLTEPPPATPSLAPDEAGRVGYPSLVMHTWQGRVGKRS
eukprot:1154923-Pelagomonas_calceolata.AAC.1